MICSKCSRSVTFEYINGGYRCPNCWHVTQDVSGNEPATVFGYPVIISDTGKYMMWDLKIELGTIDVEKIGRYLEDCFLYREIHSGEHSHD